MTIGAYMDLLDDQHSYLEDSYSQGQEIIELLNNLLVQNISDDQIIIALKELQEKNDELFNSLLDLKMNSIACLESTNTKSKIGPASDLAKSQLKVTSRGTANNDNLFIFIRELQQLNKLWMIHLNNLNKLSYSISHDFGTCNPTSKIIINKQNVPKELREILEKYDEYDKTIEDTASLRSQLMDYLEGIKKMRGKYTLENKFLLKNTVKQLNKEVSKWNQQWQSLDDILFGENSRSIKKMMQTVKTIKETITDDIDGDINMEL